MSMTNRVLRGNKRSSPSVYSPYARGPNKEEQEEEVVRLGVEFSLIVAEGMFLLSDNIRSMTLFCFWLLRNTTTMNVVAPVAVRVILVIQYVFETYIKPKNRVYLDDGCKSIHWDLMATFTQNLTSGIRSLSHIVYILKNGRLVKPSVLENYNQDLKKLAENFRSVGNVSEENGFEREAIESNILHLWKPLFDTTGEVIRPNKTITHEMFGPLLDESKQRACSRALASLQI